MPAPVQDTFAGADGSVLGNTEVGSRPWAVVSGAWTRTAGKAKTTTADSSNPIAVVDASTPNVDVSLDVSPNGGDCLYFRVVDSSNWLRLRVRRYQSPYTYYTTEYEYRGNYSGTICYGEAYSTSNTTWGPSPSTYSLWDSRCGDTFTLSLTSSSATGNSRQVANTGYTTEYQVVLEKCVAGTVTALRTYAPGTPSSLRVITAQDNISSYVNGAAQSTVAETAHKTATKHGIGRGTSDQTGSAIDNFVMDFVAAIGWGTPL